MPKCSFPLKVFFQEFSFNAQVIIRHCKGRVFFRHTMTLDIKSTLILIGVHNNHILYTVDVISTLISVYTQHSWLYLRIILKKSVNSPVFSVYFILLPLSCIEINKTAVLIHQVKCLICHYKGDFKTVRYSYWTLQADFFVNYRRKC